MTTPLGRLRRHVAPIAKTLLLHGGGYQAIRAIRPSRQLAILRYHAICSEDIREPYADAAICVTPAAFDQHVRYLAAHYRVLPLPDAARLLKADKPLPANAVCLTFDDGYADNFEAARVLHRHGLTATFYLTTSCLGNGHPFWPTELRTLVAKMSGRTITIETPRRQVLALATPQDRYRAVKLLGRLCKSSTIQVRETLRAELRQLAGIDERPTPTMLTWDQATEMVRLGMDAGGHTLTHTNLPSAGPDDAWKEIAGCRAALREHLGVDATQFSYPNGGAERYHSPELHQMVARAGFDASASSTNGFASQGSNPYALERIEVQERLEDLVFALEVERFMFRPDRQTRTTR